MFEKTFLIARHRATRAGIALALVVGLAGPSLSAVATGNLNVTATVANSCSIATNALDFSLVNVGAITNEATAGEIEVTCTASQTGATVTLDGGQNENTGQRRLEAAGNFVPYNVFSDAAHTSSVAVGGNIYSGNITAATPLTVMVYGQVPDGTYTAGTYNDVMTVTLTY